MYSQTGWADRAEIFRIVKGVDLRTVKKISSRSDNYGQFYRPIKAENGNFEISEYQLHETLKHLDLTFLRQHNIYSNNKTTIKSYHD